MKIRVHNRDEKQTAPAPPDRILPRPTPTFAGRNDRSITWMPATSSPRSTTEGHDTVSERYGFTPTTGGGTSTGSYLSPIPTSPSDNLSISAGSQPPSKRVRRESTPYNSLPSRVGTSGRVDLAGLLNPLPELSAWSPRMLELEQHAPKPTAVCEAVPQSPARVTKSQIAIRPHEPRRLVPRPPGQKPVYPPEPTHDNGEEEHKRKGRRGPLLSDRRRAQVLQVRGIGACVRCSIFRIACEATEEDQPCKPCLDTLPKARKFRVRCTRKWLKDRWDFLLQPFLIDHLNLETTNYPAITPDDDDRIIPVPLKPDIGPSVEVLAFGVKGDKIWNYSIWSANAFRSVEGERQPIHQHDRLPSLPLMPLLSDDRTSIATTRLRGTMMNAASEAVRNPHEWIEAMHDYMPWPQDVMRLVTNFYTVLYRCADTDSDALETGLRTCFMLFYMGRNFRIPKDRLSEVNEYMPQDTKLKPDTLRRAEIGHDEIIPRFLDRYMKSAILPDAQGLLAITFSELERAFRLQDKDKGDEKLSDIARDKIFCMLVLVIIMTGITQSTTLQKAYAMAAEEPDKEAEYMEKAKVCIKKAEGEVVDHILNLWSYKFPKGAASGRLTTSELPVAEEARRIAIIERFQQSRDKYPDLAHKVLDVNVDDPPYFMSHNLERLLLRVDACLRGKLKQTSIESPETNDVS